MRYSLNYRTVLAFLLASIALQGCYHNSEYQSPEEKARAAAKKAYCDQVPKPERCTADPATFKKWGYGGAITRLFFEDQPISDGGGKDLNSFLKIGNPLSAHSRYFKHIYQTNKYAIVFELVGFDKNSTEKQNVYLFQWLSDWIDEVPLVDEVELKLGSKAKGLIPPQVYNATVTPKSNGEFHLITTPRQIAVPTSSIDDNSPPLIFEDAVIDMTFKPMDTIEVGDLISSTTLKRKPHMNFEGTIRGKLTRKSYVAGFLYKAQKMCGTGCIKDLTETRCTLQDKPNCPSNCSEIQNFCDSGDNYLNSGFSYNVGQEPYAAATASLKIVGHGVQIIKLRL